MNILTTKINCHALWLMALVVMGQSYLYLFDTSVKVFGVPAADIPLALACFWGFITWVSLMEDENPKFRFGWLLFAPIVLALLSAGQASRLFGQSFSAGFLVQRQFFVWGFLYFPARKLIYCKKISLRGLAEILGLVVLAELTLFILNYFIGGGMLVVYTGTRYGDERYYFQPALLDMAFLFCVAQLFLDKNGRSISLTYCLLIAFAVLFDVVVVQKFRLTSVGLVVCLVLAVVLAKTGVERRLVVIAAVLVFFAAISTTQMFQDVMTAFFRGDSNLDIREIGRELYFSSVANHPLIGCGIAHESCSAAYAAAGIYRNIFFVDNGVPALIYIYGLAGLFWMAALWIKMLRMGWVLNAGGYSSFYLLVPLFFVITSINEAHWYWMNGFELLTLFIVFMEGKYDAMRQSSCFAEGLVS